MKNIDMIKSLSAEALALLLVKEEVYADNIFFVSPSCGFELFEDYDAAVNNCIAWLNANCE